MARTEPHQEGCTRMEMASGSVGRDQNTDLTWNL